MTVQTAASVGPQCPKHDGVLRIATLNVSTLKGRMPEVLQLAEDCSVDILCLQEVRLSEDNLLAASHTAKRSGWQFLAGSCAINGAGAPTAGVAIVSKWPVDNFVFASEPPDLCSHKGRWQCIRVHRPGLRPFICTNMYLHASDRRAASELGKLLFEATAVCGEDAMFIGDWNCTPEEEPACSVLRSGRLHLADEVAGIEAVSDPTRRRGRHIDFAFHTVRLVPHARSKFAGVADHCLIPYDFQVAQLENFYTVARPRPLLASLPVSPDVWDLSFPQSIFDELLVQHDVQAAWNLLSDHAEFVLQAKPERKRSQVPAPTQVAPQNTKVHKLQSVLERRLRRTLRRLDELQQSHAPWNLRVKVQDALVYLCKHFPELSEIKDFGPDLYLVLQKCLQKETLASQEARLQTWRQQMEEDEASLVRWVKGADAQCSFSTPDPDVPVHPQSKAEFFCAVLEKCFCKLMPTSTSKPCCLFLNGSRLKVSIVRSLPSVPKISCPLPGKQQALRVVQMVGKGTSGHFCLSTFFTL